MVFILFFLLVIALYIIVLYMNHKAHVKILVKWAIENGYTILSYNVSDFNFKLVSSNAQKVFHVIIIDYTGCTCEGWIRTGSYFGVACSDKTVEKWKGELEPTSIKSLSQSISPPPLPTRPTQICGSSSRKSEENE